MGIELQRDVGALILGLLALTILCLLGCPLAAVAWPKRGDFGLTLAGAPGLGVAVVACTWLITAYVGITVWPVLIASVLVAAGWAIWRVRRGFPRVGWSLGLVIVGGMAVLAWRIAQVQGLAFPAWVDSVHHALVVRVMLERGQVPRDLSPYLPGPFFYHFAFHALASSLARAGGLSIPQAMLVMGQVLQAVIVLSVYRLGQTLWKDTLWAGTAAVLVTWVAQMPAHYTAWAKYPLATAMALMPLAMSLVLELSQDESWPGFASSQRMGVAGLALVLVAAISAHYFAALTLALFMALAWVQAWVRGRWGAGSRAWTRIAGGCVLAVLLAAPWIAWVWSNAGRFMAVQAGEGLLAPDQTYFPGYLGYLWALTGPLRNRLLLALALPGLILILRRRGARVMGLWVISLLLLGSPWGWRLQPFSPDRVLIMLALPAALLTTETLAWLTRLLANAGGFGRSRLGVRGLVSTCILIWCLWGAVETRDLIREDEILADAADARALAWVGANVPADARFFIGVVPWPPYGYRGADGGWWLLPMTGRQTLLPPALYGLGDSREVERLNTLAARAANIGGCGPPFWDLVAEAGVTHVYFNTAHSTLQPRGFDGCPAVEPIYVEGGVYVYRLLWPPADQTGG